jgi:1,2-diacylglycerol 3-beta-galactosyltransferase
MGRFIDSGIEKRAPVTDVLILTSSTGAGHDSVAVALQEALRSDSPEISTRILDPLAGRSSNGPLSAGPLYDAMAAHAPWLWGLCYHATNNTWAVRLGMAAAARLWAPRLRSTILDERPGIIVSVHPLCTRLAGDILRTVPSAPPLHCVVTDLVTIHRCWACPAVDAFYVATHDAQDALVSMGIPCERIQVSGLPLRASFAQALHISPEEATPRVLILGGGRSSRRIEKITRALAASHLPTRLVVVCGRNRCLQRRLSQGLGARALVLGWRDDIAALMRWSTVVISKGGPTTLAEALSQGRPVMVNQVLPGQEGGNVRLLQRTGSGRYISDVDALVRAVTTSPSAQRTTNTSYAAWWGGAAQRVAAGIVTAHADAIAPRQSAYQEESALSGRVIDNPVSGERIIIRETGEQTGGRLLSFDLFLPPGAHVPARHLHPVQEERFTVMAGRMRFRVGRQTILANPGQTIPIPAGTAHWFGNIGAEVSHARVEVRPALRMEELFETAAEIGRAGHFPGTKMPRLSDLALFLNEFQRELAVPNMPAFLVRGFLAPFAWIGRRRAHKIQPGSTR